ncbi:MAG: hypothetical protein EBQ89_00705 [Alphaproteobacteria bacterium]|nr:hypothetical protein [Alphaproteobacteria bacterium]
MKTLTTKAAVKALKRELGERARQMDLVVVENESGTVQVEATPDQIEDFERIEDKVLDSDVISDQLMEELVDFLRRENLLEKEK